MDYSSLTVMDSSSLTVVKIDDTEFKEKLQRLADRLGVEPSVQSDGRFRFTVGATSGGPVFDMLDMLHAMLDRMDALTKSET